VVEVERHVGEATYFQYLIMDHRGTAYKVTDPDGTTQIAYTLDAFGRQLAAPAGADPSVANELVYQTNWLALAFQSRLLGLSPSRLYDEEGGRFIQRDALFVAQPLAERSGGRALGIYHETVFAAYVMPFGEGLIVRRARVTSNLPEEAVWCLPRNPGGRRARPTMYGGPRVPWGVDPSGFNGEEEECPPEIPIDTTLKDELTAVGVPQGFKPGEVTAMIEEAKKWRWHPGEPWALVPAPRFARAASYTRGFDFYVTVYYRTCACNAAGKRVWMKQSKTFKYTYFTGMNVPEASADEDADEQKRRQVWMIARQKEAWNSVPSK
jgi:hypothetical protein